MTNVFYLIRHGDKPNIAGDPRLSKLGIKQAYITALHFKDKNIHQIYSSSARRARKTAQVIAKELKINNIKIDSRLQERFYWGNDFLKTFDDFLKEWKKSVYNRDYKPLIGDSSREAGTRLKELIDKLHNQNNNQNIILVSHGGVIVDLLRNLFTDEYLKTFSSDFLETGILECSITQLVINGNKYILKEFNTGTHLN